MKHSKVNLADLNKELSNIRKRIIEEIKFVISERKVSTAFFYDNDVYIVNYDEDAFILSATKNGKVVIRNPKTEEEEVFKLEAIPTDILLLMLQILNKKPEVFKQN